MTTPPVPSITDEQLAEIESAAQAATGGEWEYRLGLIRTLPDSDGYVPIAVAPNSPKNWRGQRDINMQYIAMAMPSSLLALITRLRAAEADARLSQVSTLTEWYSNSLDVINEVAAALPGAHYMDPPDGGDVSIPEQVRRMAKDAERYRLLRDGSGWPAVFASHDAPEPLRGADLDTAMERHP